MIDGLAEKLHSLGIQPNDLSLYESAFTHASYTNEHPECPSYDRLEYLGDSLLDMIVADLLYHAYPKANSGLLSKMRARLVEGSTLTAFTEDLLGMSSFIRYSVGEKGNEKNHRKIHEDVFESFMAAIYLDQGYPTVRKFLEKIYAPYIEKADVLIREVTADPKTQLQENLNGQSPDYVVVETKNLNTANVEFTVEARYQQVVIGVGKGHNHVEAERNAAIDALNKSVGKK